MIVKLAEPGKSYGGTSFKGLGAYLLHDPDKAATSERVAWTHTLNLASDHPASAIDEMIWTLRAAEDLKRESGGRAGGRPLEHPVKHLSLNWHPSEAPSKAHMIETVESFLSHMGWQEHQALIVCHTDKHPHVHVMLNVVHPETGRALDAGFEKRRASRWAERYEHDHDLIFCEERLKPIEQRTPSPTRATWEALRQSELQHDRIEVERVAPSFDYFARHDTKTGNAKEWEMLKAHQREERDAFFMAGKQAYRDVRDEVFREVRAAFREEWRDYYAASRTGTDAEELASMKGAILTAQAAALDQGRKAACDELRERRDLDYAGLLRDQKQQRAELTLAQKHGERSPDLLGHIYRERSERAEPDVDGIVPGWSRSYFGLDAAFRQAGAETCEPTRRPDVTERETEPTAQDRDDDRSGGDRLGIRDGADAMGGMALSLLGGIAKLGEQLFDGFLGGGPAAPPPPPPSAAVEKQERANARRTAEAQTAATAEEAEVKKLRAYWDERMHRKRERDGARV